MSQRAAGSIFAHSAVRAACHTQACRRLEERMFARLMIAALVLAGLSTPAAAQTENLQIFRAVQRQVLQYPHFTMFDSVYAQIDNGVVVLTGKVTMPYKGDAIEQRA